MCALQASRSNCGACVDVEPQVRKKGSQWYRSISVCSPALVPALAPLRLCRTRVARLSLLIGGFHLASGRGQHCAWVDGGVDRVLRVSAARGDGAALWACVAAAEFPDIDIALAPLGHETFFRWHRTFTHSAVLLPFWAVLLAWAFWEISGRKNFRLMFGGAAGIASHLGMDWATNYGTELFWPLSDARLALSWVFIVDVYVWGLLGTGLVVALWSRPERGAFRAKTRWRWWAPIF